MNVLKIQQKTDLLPQEEFKLRVEEAEQGSAGRDFSVTVIDHLSLVTQILPVDTLGARG